MEGITDADYAYTKKVCKDFQTKNLGNDLHLRVQSNTLLLDGVFENVRNMCLKTVKLNCAKYLWGLGWQAALKWKKVKLYILTNIDMLLIWKI